MAKVTTLDEANAEISKLAEAVVQITDLLKSEKILTGSLVVSFKDAKGQTQQVAVSGASPGLAGDRC